jgi:transcriptional regulator GlxA family with amidase domain
MHNAVLTDWIKARSQDAELVLSVGTGALLLAKAGLRDGLEAATHHGAIDLRRVDWHRREVFKGEARHRG